MYTKVLSILFFTIFLIFKVIRKYMLEKNIGKKKIIDEEYKIDDLVKLNYKQILLVFVMFIIVSRIYKFGAVPACMGCDEAGAAYDAYCLANWGVDRYLNKLPVYLINFGGGQSALYVYLTVIFIKLFGTNIISYRLPELLFFIASIVVSYILVNKFKDKKTALLFTFLIIICPWHIEASREGIDCNLLAPMFILDLLLLSIAQDRKKSYMYIIAGISIGITLYTYALSYLLIPVFLIVYIGYMIYIKNINLRQIVLLGIPIFILAIPLMWMILLNKGIVDKTNLGIFTIPKLFIYRQNEIKFSNLYRYGWYSIKCIFFSEDGLYLLEVPFFLIGCYVSVKEIIKSFQTKTFNITALIFMSLVAMLLTNLTVPIWTLNRGNILFIPILYITAIGMIYMTKNSVKLTILNIAFLTILFINYESMYFIPKDYAMDPYKDNEISAITENIESNDINKEAEKYIISNRKAGPYIYTLIANKMSPYDFYSTADIEIDGPKVTLKSYGKYHFIFDKELYNRIKNDEKDTKYIIVIDKAYEEKINQLLNHGFSQEDSNSYYIMKNY